MEHQAAAASGGGGAGGGAGGSPTAAAAAAAAAGAGGGSPPAAAAAAAPGAADIPQQLRAQTSFLIGVAGGTASGKTTVCTQIMHRLHDQCVALISQDSFYRGLTPDELKDVNSYNFDSPDAFDHAALLQCLTDLKAGRSVEVPIYDFTRHARSSEVRKVEPSDVIIVEGILVLHVAELRELLNMCIYVDTDDDIRLARRIQRDVAERGRCINGVLEMYTKFVKPSFDQYVAPSRRYADLIIPWQRGDNIVAIDLVTEHIKTKLQQHSLVRVFPNLFIMPSSHQIRGMHTILRAASTRKSDFQFFSDRLNRLVVEAALGLLPFSERTVVTPTGHKYVGVEFAKRLCGVAIIRSGESMEAALRTCCKGIKIGKILVVRHHGQQQQPGQLAAAMSTRGTHALSPRAGRAQQAANGLSSSSSSSAFASTLQQQQQRGGGGGSSSRPDAAVDSLQQQLGAASLSSAPSSSQHKQQQQQQPGGSTTTTFHSSEGSAFAAAARSGSVAAAGSPRAGPDQDVIYEKLPADIAQRSVLLMDPVLSTGNSAARAIEVLLARGVAQERIILCTIIAAPEGISRICGRFPHVRLVTSEVDKCVDDRYQVVPGMGEFGDRYFCD